MDGVVQPWVVVLPYDLLPVLVFPLNFSRGTFELFLVEIELINEGMVNLNVEFIFFSPLFPFGFDMARNPSRLVSEDLDVSWIGDDPLLTPTLYAFPETAETPFIDVDS